MREEDSSIFVVSVAEEDAVIPAIGVSAKLLRTSVIDGEQARDRCTPNHPLSMPGFVAWGEANRSIRDLLVPLKWTPKNRKNFPTIVSPDGGTAISVASGDAGTGDRGFTPTTKNPKGMATRDFIVMNQLSLLPPIGGVTPIKKKARETTWLLLVNRRPGPDGGEFIYSEISRPRSMEGKWIVTWGPRIILPPIDYATVSKRRRDEEDEGADLDVPVARREDKDE